MNKMFGLLFILC